MTDDAITMPRPCPLWRRLAALVYDLLVTVAIVMVVGLLCQLATGGRLIGTGDEIAIPLWYRPLQAVVVAAYFVSSWRYGGQTVGMRAWHIRLCADDGTALSLQRGVRRAIIAATPLLALALAPVFDLRTTLWITLGAWALWFAPALFDARRRALHDMLAGTQLRLSR